MQKSPSCGMHRVKLYQDNGHLAEHGAASSPPTFARYPELPMEEDGRLNDPVLRENFISRVFAYARWQRLCRDGLTARPHRLPLPPQVPADGPQPAAAKARPPAGPASATTTWPSWPPATSRELMSGAERRATRGTHANVLQHLTGYLSSPCPVRSARIQHLISQYRGGVLPWWYR